MKTCRTLFRSFRDAVKSVGRNFSLSLASVSCITITLIIIASALLVSENVKNFTKEIEKDVTIVVFLNSDITEEDKESFEVKVKAMDNIDSYEFESKRDVKAEMIDENETFSTILSDWDDESNPLKDTYKIKVVDVEQISNTADEIKKIDGVNTVQYGEGLVEKLVGVFDAIERITMIGAIALTVVTIFLIINTIKLTIFSRKREIGIMRLVGASNIRIKLPFVFEGIILGLIGSIIPIILIVYGYTALYNHFDGYVFSELIKLIKPMPFILYSSVLVALVGIVVGMIGSARAVRRYVKI